MLRFPHVIAATCISVCALLTVSIPTAAQVPVDQFVNFETAHVHPLEMTPDGSKLLAVNTASNELEVFNIDGNGALTNVASIPVGHDPVSVRARSNTEVWVANVISDSISIVDLNINAVVRTLQTADEPSDIAFAGSPQRAFVSCAERELVQVFDLDNLSASPEEVWLIGEQPRALAVSNDGQTVYAAFFESGNQTTVVAGNEAHASGELRINRDRGTSTPNDVTRSSGPYGGQVPVPNDGNNFNPPMNPDLPAKTDTQSLVVKKQPDGTWLDDNGGDWTNIVSGGAGNRIAGWDLKDRDVAMINANTLDVSYQNTLGNILMAMSVNPVSDDVYVVGTDAMNHIRFAPNINGTFMRHQVSLFTPGDESVDIVDLNQHLDYSTPSVSNPVKQQSIGDPRSVTWTSDGSVAYVSGMGSNNIIKIDSSGNRVDNPIFVGEGPTGIAIDENRANVYVLNKFNGSISTVDLNTDDHYGETFFYDPTPQVIKTGRKHLYDTISGSGNGTISCASCHVDGKWDRLAWDLGDPSGEMKTVDGRQFHPLMGLKVTQTLIDVIGRDFLHWRGDQIDFRDFHLAFENLKGREPVSEQAMQEFQDFMATTFYPPNPYRDPDQTGFTFMNDLPIRGPGFSTMRITFSSDNMFEGFGDIPTTSNWDGNCGFCHQLGTGRGTERVGENRAADLRTAYRKLGYWQDSTESTAGFGFMADGIFDTFRMDNSFGTIRYLVDYPPFVMMFAGPKGSSLGGFGVNGIFLGDDADQSAHPAVGMQETLNGSVGSVNLISELLSLANGNGWGPVGLIVKGMYQGEQRGFTHTGGNDYQTDRDGEVVSHFQLVAAAQANNGEPLTWTIVRESTAQRLGIDRNANGLLNLDDFDDADNDGVADEVDLFPNDPSESADADGDGIGNSADQDDDNDGVLDENDDLPFNPSESVDSDADGIGNNADTDDDGDGVADADDLFPLNFEESADTDGDGIGDNADIDADNDGIPDELESGSALDANITRVLSDSAAEFAAAETGDWVSISRAEYNALSENILDVSRFGTSDANMQTGPLANWSGNNRYSFGQSNNPSPAGNHHFIAFKRGTGIPTRGNDDFVYLSQNNNGSNFQTIGNPLFDGTVENNEEYWVQKGADERAFSQPMYLGISTDETNPIRYNANGTTGFQGEDFGNMVSSPVGFALQGLAMAVLQNDDAPALDSDNDGVPNQQDLDSDNDGIPDVIEGGGTDANSDGIIDDAFNNQGTLEVLPDSDNNRIPDFLDANGNFVFSNPIADSDGDGWEDSVDGSIGGEDFDNDGIPDSTDPDDDNDGVNDINDAFPRDASESVDTDNDGIGNNADTDDDGDGVIDSADAFPLDPSRSSFDEEPDPNPQNDGVISNVASGITLDGNLNDWSNYEGFAADPDDVEGLNNPLDWLQAWMAHDADNFYLAYRNDGAVNPSWGQTVYIDTDRNQGTGYNSGLAIGADYVLQAQVLYRYSGDGSSWAWDFITEAQTGTGSGTFEMRLAQTALGSPDVIRLAFYGSNAAYPDGSAEDLYPDGIYDSNSATRYLEYTASAPENSAPLANSQSVIVTQNSNLAITLSGSDADGDTLSYAIAAQPANGTLSGTAPNVTYTPSADYTGADGFSFTVNDGQLTSGIATVTINVQSEGEQQITSNRATELTVDGNLDDWAEFRSFGADADDINGNENPIDWREGWIAHDEQNFYFAYRNDGGDVGAIDNWGFNLFIDSDRNAATGYSDGTAIGADFLLQGGSLYRFSGAQQSDWSWTFVAGAVRATSGSDAEIGISRQALDDTGEFDVIFLGDNASIGGNTEDQYPDGVYDGNDATRFFSYSTNGLPSIEIEPLIQEANPSVIVPFSGRLELYDNAHPLPRSSQTINSTGGSGPISPAWLLLGVIAIMRRREQDDSLESVKPLPCNAGGAG